MRSLWGVPGRPVQRYPGTSRAFGKEHREKRRIKSWDFLMRDSLAKHPAEGCSGKAAGKERAPGPAVLPLLERWGPTAQSPMGLAGSAPQAGWSYLCSLPITCDSLGQHLSLPQALLYSALCMPWARLTLA